MYFENFYLLAEFCLLGKALTSTANRAQFYWKCSSPSIAPLPFGLPSAVTEPSHFPHWSAKYLPKL